MSRWGRLGLLVGIVCSAFLILTFWYAANSDQDNIPPLLTQMIPAGHATCQSATVFQCSSCLEQHYSSVNDTGAELWTYEYARDGQNEGLSEAQCNVAFPGLFEDINLATKHWTSNGKISTQRLDRVHLENGMTRAMIFEGNLYVVQTRSKAEDHRRKTIATLNSIHRALSAAPDRRSMPNIDFIFSIEDKATDVTGSKTLPLWVLARKASEQSYFLFPDFGYWAWDNMIGKMNNEIGPYDEVVDKALARERDITFRDKVPELVWRGKLSFAPKLRRALLDAARRKPWNNVKELNWMVKDNYLALDEHCKYQFIAHVEGRSYSASLKYRQACRSVIVAHKLQYIQHHHYLLNPSGPLQNYVEVERDFSDLDEKMNALLADPARAQTIADNSVRTFRERYLTPAAEACYWRALWRGYGQVSEEARLFHHTRADNKVKRGLRFETFMLLSSDEMMDYKSSEG
ncbi:uncharacterized protein MYCFIDRAFT_32648 [Pseudocercospora fijiensis CIRAD86]|uniref:Glycosyl transferase CAP10 domain-containing protein n=1 Tax=Pseudocercospora fijiensis (strain CIRAD86) TaxID=383855 RepID=M2ZRC0_PSEFD|nr:uncharacterized protein MYCFIDRAFT_32648 [Pseudocercospora fijiensis CIRAD86]EME81599.1 hypothetical protein MYCFIDRAFT_32648 [Pseudocercospora fijiensis CIRAD86]